MLEDLLPRLCTHLSVGIGGVGGFSYLLAVGGRFSSFSQGTLHRAASVFSQDSG